MACVGQAAQNPSALGSKQEFTHVKALLNAVPKRDLCHRQATASKARIVITWRSAQDRKPPRRTGVKSRAGTITTQLLLSRWAHPALAPAISRCSMRMGLM
jgi:hypothetical protein